MTESLRARVMGLDLEAYRTNLATINAKADRERNVLARKLLGLSPPKAKPKRERKPRPHIEGALLTPEDAAAYLGVCIKTLGALRIPYIPTGQGRVKPHRKYHRADLNRFIEQQRQQEANPCRSIASPTPRSSTPSSRSEVIDIAARLRSAANAKPKR